ncbi:MAG: helix-turn-helix domain-containing protein [Pseudoxanthomonas sp.]
MSERVRRPLEIAILLFPQAQMAAVHGLTDLFGFADTLARARSGSDEPLLRVSHFRQGAAGHMERSFDTLPGADTQPVVVIVPPCHLSTVADTAASTAILVAWLRARDADGATLASVCGGTFLLAETGLLDGLTATTHWIYANELAARFPAVHVDANPLLIDHGRILTAGGLMAWPDLGLTLVDRLLGAAAMIETGRFMMIDPPGREQRFYSAFVPALSHGDEAVLKAQEVLKTDPTAGISVSALATLAGLHERTFVRRFHKATGLKPNHYQQHLRVDKARQLLEATVQQIDTIAWSVGYSDPGSFRRVFARITGLSPGDYRKRFAHERVSAAPQGHRVQRA